MTLEALARDGLIIVDRFPPFITDQRTLRRACERGELVRLRRGVYVDRRRWEAADSREQHILRIRAVLAAAQRPAVFAGMSAAALWGFPIEGDWPREVTILDEWRGGGRSEPGVRRTAAGFMTAHLVELQGFRVTNLARTALDVARRYPFAEAVGSVDWALSNRNANAITPRDLSEELERLGPRTGLRHLEQIAGFGTSLSGSYGESTARAVIHLLGFEAPELQVAFRDAEGRMDADFFWRGVCVCVWRGSSTGSRSTRDRSTRMETPARWCGGRKNAKTG